MGDCQYCGKPAGFLKSKHEECQNRFDYGIKKIISLIRVAFFKDSDLNEVKEEAKKLLPIPLSLKMI